MAHMGLRQFPGYKKAANFELQDLKEIIFAAGGPVYTNQSRGLLLVEIKLM